MNKSTDHKPEPKKGICYLVGAGPGDPGLLTVKGQQCIQQAEVLIYDALSSPQLLNLAPENCELIDAGKRAKQHKLSQDEINAICVKKAQEGKTVTRLKGGDPLIFGRGGEEAAELAKAGIPFELVPGISSAIAGPAYAGIPATHRQHGSQLTIFTGHEDPTKAESSIDYPHLAKTPGTKIFLMGMSHLAEICQKLIDGGSPPNTPMALVRWATTPQQQTLTGTLATIPELAKARHFSSPAIAVIGTIVEERKKINWFEKRLLFGKKIVVTRTRSQASSLYKSLTTLGADVLEIPTIQISPPKNPAALLEAVKDAHRYDWLIFTSPNGVERFFESFYIHFEDARSLGGVKIAAIGPATAEKIRHYRFAVDLLPTRHVAEGLVEAFKKQTIENQTLLWIKAEKTRQIISEEISKMGGIIDHVAAI